MDHELTAKWHELDKIQIGLKDAVVLQPDLSDVQRQIGDLADLTTEAKDTLVAAINEAARTGGGSGSMDLRVADGYIQYSTDDGGTWQNLIAVADLKGADGAPGTPGKDGAGMDITGATIGQIAKITAVDSDGVPTAWSPVDMPTGEGGELQWIEVVDITTAEQTQKLTISVDKDGRPISQYNALWMIFSILFPADATQTSTNGAPWIYPFPKTGDNAYRYIATVAGWKTTGRTLTYAWAGLPRIPWSSVMTGQTTFGTDGDPDFLSGLCVFLNSSSDHIPAGARVRIAVLSKGVTA